VVHPGDEPGPQPSREPAFREPHLDRRRRHRDVALEHVGEPERVVGAHADARVEDAAVECDLDRVAGEAFPEIDAKLRHAPPRSPPWRRVGTWRHAGARNQRAASLPLPSPLARTPRGPIGPTT
jgi:hypothetical protein